MELQSAVKYYVDAWNQHDVDGIISAFLATGMWHDPTIATPVNGLALAAHVGQWFVAFPDLALTIDPPLPMTGSTIALQWRMTGTNLGPLEGQPPSGGRIDLRGADFLTFTEAGIQSVHRYFDQKALLEQVGLQVLVTPTRLGPLVFGDSLRLDLGRRAQPGALSVNVLEFGSEHEGEAIQAFGQLIMRELEQVPGFISLVITGQGMRSSLITAWEKADQPRQMLRGGTHKDAISRFHDTSFIASEFSSVWTPLYQFWRVRCPSCGNKVKAERDNETCRCGALLPELPAF